MRIRPFSRTTLAAPLSLIALTAALAGCSSPTVDAATAIDGGGADARGDGGVAPARLGISGHQILDPNGAPIILRG